MKSRLVSIGLIQTRVSNNLNSNLFKTIKMIKRAAQSGAQIICLQELFRTPYFPQKRYANKNLFFEEISGDTISRLKELAKELQIIIIAPIFEKEGGKYFNTAVVINEKGKVLGKYHKIHIPQDPGFYEKDYFEDGNIGYKIFKTKFGLITVLICYDQWFPEAAREVRLAGAEIIFYPTAIGNIIGEKPLEGNWQNAWETVMRGHAIANSLPIVAINRVGIEGKTEFWGQSFVCDAFGKVIKRGDKRKEQIIIAQVDLAMNKYISDGWGFIKNRRPDTYKDIVKNNK